MYLKIPSGKWWPFCLSLNVLKHAVHACIHHYHDDVIKRKHFPRYWPFVRGIHRSPVNSPHKGQWRGALMFSLICARINDWVNNGEAGDLRRHRAHCDVIVIHLTRHIHLMHRWLMCRQCLHNSGTRCLHCMHVNKWKAEENGRHFFQTIFSNAFSSMKSFVFWFGFQSLFCHGSNW